MKVLILGKKGMLGQMVCKYFEERNIDYVGLSREEFDVLNNNLEEVVNLKEFDTVINCIGILNHDNNAKKYILVNSLFPVIMDELSVKYDFKFIHISTDCFMDNSMYGHSKWLGEKLNNSLILRTSIIGPGYIKKGTGLFNWFMNQKEECNGYTKHFWYGITTLELSKLLRDCLNSDIRGIYEVSNGMPISKYELLCMIKTIYAKNIKILPYETEIVDKKLNSDLGIIPNYEIMINEMKNFSLKRNL